jgi:hypothetical protein
MNLLPRALTTLVLATVLGLGLFVTSPAHAVTWAPAATAPIHPGVQTITGGTNQCTANFVFTNGTDVFIGQAAHCSGTGAATDTNGCTAASMPINTTVEVDGATRPATMVYNSWLTMQSTPAQEDADTCQYNDLALVKLDAADAGRVNPSIPVYGGPVGISSGTALGENVYSYGNSSLRFGFTPLSPKRGISLGDSAGGWTHDVYTVTPGIPGDSGSAFLDQSGRALGVLSTVAIAPLPLSNGVGDVRLEIAYMQAHGFSASLVNGTEPFTPGALL